MRKGDLYLVSPSCLTTQQFTRAREGSASTSLYPFRLSRDTLARCRENPLAGSRTRSRSRSRSRATHTPHLLTTITPLAFRRAKPGTVSVFARGRWCASALPMEWRTWRPGRSRGPGSIRCTLTSRFPDCSGHQDRDYLSTSIPFQNGTILTFRPCCTGPNRLVVRVISPETDRIPDPNPNPGRLRRSPRPVQP